MNLRTRGSRSRGTTREDSDIGLAVYRPPRRHFRIGRLDGATGELGGRHAGGSITGRDAGSSLTFLPRRARKKPTN
jgi:hypothetical protein